MKKNSAQTLVEFLLVFVVLLAASAGAFSLYKKAWKSRYDRTQYSSVIGYVK
jgi:hypothetical protein